MKVGKLYLIPLSIFNVSNTVFIPRLFEGMNHTHIIKLQKDDKSIIKRTGGNTFCAFALSMKHALLITLSPLFLYWRKILQGVYSFGAKRFLIKKQFTYYNFK